MNNGSHLPVEKPVPKGTRHTMKITTLLVAVPVLAGLLAMGAQAQPINERQHNQHARIEGGERNGSLTGRESERLEGREARIRRAEARDRRSGGKFTLRERHNIQQRLNGTSRAIYRDRHNGHHRRDH